jgi:hypothetical protein
MKIIYETDKIRFCEYDTDWNKLPMYPTTEINKGDGHIMAMKTWNGKGLFATNDIDKLRKEHNYLFK